jgi:predicted transcriptional regulator
MDETRILSESVPAGEESSKAAATTNPSLTQTMIRIILDATIRSSDVNYNGGTIRSRIITTYSRINHHELRKYLPVLVAQGLISQENEILAQDNPRHASRMSDKNRANATKTIYRVTPKGYDWLSSQQQEQEKQSSRSKQ